MLSRLAAQRGLDARALARAVDLPNTELTAVFGGRQPSASLLRQLAPAFGLHTSADVRPGGEREYDRWFQPGFGAVLMRLFGNRNMPAIQAVKALFMLASFGPWSPSTLNLVGHGRKDVSAELVAASVLVLGIPACDLAAMADVRLDEQAGPPEYAISDASALIWEARCIAGAQMAQLNELSHVLYHHCSEFLHPLKACSCSLLREPLTSGAEDESDPEHAAG